jgi:hypothetical protein
VLKINHTDVDNNTYRVYIRINNYTSYLPSGSYILLKIYDKDGNLVNETNLNSISSLPSEPVFIGNLNSEMIWRVDIKVFIPEGSPISTTSAEVDMQLIYTPSTDETPP